MASYLYGPVADAATTNVFFTGAADGASCVFSTDGYGTGLNMSTYVAFTDSFSSLRMTTSNWPLGVADTPIASYFARLWFGVSVSNNVTGNIYMRLVRMTPSVASALLLFGSVNTTYVAGSPYVVTSTVYTNNILGGAMPILTSNVLTDTGPWQLQIDTVNGITGGSIIVYGAWLGITTASWPTQATADKATPTETLSLQPFVQVTEKATPTETIITPQAVVVTETAHATEAFSRDVVFRGAATTGGNRPARPQIPNVQRT